MLFRQKYVRSFDGTRIGYQVSGRGETCFLLCNGLGGSMVAWTPITERFGDRFRFITWDYRGLFTSAVPENLATLAIPFHVRDAEAVLKKEKVTRGLVGGWSMGVQVALELYRQRPEFARALFLMNGAAGYPLRTAFHSPLTRYIVPAINAVIKKLMPKLQPRMAPVAKRVVSTDEFVRAIVGLGLIHRNFNTAIFRKIAHDILGTNLAVYHDVLDHLAVHDASDVLPRVRVPTLLVSGTRDIMTPSHVAESMAKRIPGAELFVLNLGSHYALMEFPELINGRLEQFLKEHRLSGSPRRPTGRKRLLKRAG